MTLVVASRRLKSATLTKRFGPGARCLDLTSRGDEPWVRFSPFFPHGAVIVLGDMDTTAAMVGGIVSLVVGETGIPEQWRAVREPFPGWAST